MKIKEENGEKDFLYFTTGIVYAKYNFEIMNFMIFYIFIINSM